MAGARRRQEAGVKIPDEIPNEPWLYDFFDLLRRIERDQLSNSATEERTQFPRIGDADNRRDDLVLLGQDPYFSFPASNLSKVAPLPDGRTRVLVKFLGLLGPQGALPLATTEEAYHWTLAGDDAFPRFLDLINHRFLQLFFRAWADARPSAQHDRPAQDRFVAFIGSAIGLGSPPFRDRDSLCDWSKLGYAGLLGAKAKSASRLRGAISGLFAIEAEIQPFVGSNLALDADDCTRLGAKMATLGDDCMIGASYFSIQDKFRIRLYAQDMEQYCRFLPDGDLCEPLVDLIYFYLGDELDWDVELALPAAKAPPVRLPEKDARPDAPPAMLGWTSWLAPDRSQQGYRCDAVFHAAERIGRKRREARASQKNRGGNT
jgi:type VI secretion system protein ImpH